MRRVKQFALLCSILKSHPDDSTVQSMMHMKKAHINLKPLSLQVKLNLFQPIYASYLLYLSYQMNECTYCNFNLLFCRLWQTKEQEQMWTNLTTFPVTAIALVSATALITSKFFVFNMLFSFALISCFCSPCLIKGFLCFIKAF